MNGIGKLYTNDFVKNLINVVGIAVLLVLYNLVIQADFDLFKVDYVALVRQIANVSIVAVVVDLGRRFLSTSKGSLLGITPEDN